MATSHHWRMLDPFGDACCSANMVVNKFSPLEGHCSVCGKIWELAPSDKWYTSWAFRVMDEFERAQRK